MKKNVAFYLCLFLIVYKTLSQANYELAIDYQFTNTIGFNEGLAPVTKSETKRGWGYIDESGNVIIDYIYYSAHPFSEGLQAFFKE